MIDYTTVLLTFVYVVLLRMAGGVQVPLTGRAVVLRHEVTLSGPGTLGKMPLKRNTKVAELVLYYQKLHLDFKQFAS